MRGESTTVDMVEVLYETKYRSEIVRKERSILVRM